MLKIIGLGPGAPESLTIGAVEALQESKKTFFRTEKHPTVDYLKNKIKEINTCDNFYEDSDSFDEVYRKIAEKIIAEYKECGDLIYAVPGHPLVAEKSVLNIINLCGENNIPYEIVPAVSFIDAMMESLKIDPIEGLKIIDAFDIKNQILDKRIGTVITQVYNPFIASEVKLQLLEYYNDETEIYYVRAAGIKGEESIRKIPIYEIDMQEDIDYLTSLYIPKDINNKKDFWDLLDVVKTLRSDEGCPWDREQTHESIKNELLEECYEVVEAIDDENIDGLIEELGDVLFHVVFHANIGSEDGYFNIGDIISGICEKMIYRHPHVFKESSEKTTEEVINDWDKLKKKEKQYDSISEEINSIAKTLPALTRAHKIQKKASKVGLDFKDPMEAFEKIKEELNEVKDEYNSKNREKLLDELGDLLFSCVNLIRLLNVDEEECLRKANDKFIKRFTFIEKSIANLGKTFNDISDNELNELWESAKKVE